MIHAMYNRKVIFPGTFDPFTLGHYDILSRLTNLFDEVYIAVAVNTEKDPIFTLDERKEMIKTVTQKNPQIHVVAFEGLATEFMKNNEINVLARGVRDTYDLLHESRISRMNKMLYPEMETIFLHTAEGYAYISSSLIKEILRFKGSIEGLVPESLIDIITKKYL